MLDLRVLGTLAIQSPNGGAPVAGVTQPKLLALLLYLALAEPSGPQSRESLMALLWPEADDESTRHSLRNTLYGLRQALGEGAIVSRGEGYVALDPATVRCDAVEVRGLLAAERWKDALAGWRGDLAPGFHISGAPEFERWLDEQRAALRRAVADAGWRRVDEMEKSGEPGIGEAARRAWAIDPSNETGARRLMQLLDGTTGPAAALRAYDDLVDYLRREYETVPSAETRAAADRLSTPNPVVSAASSARRRRVRHRGDSSRDCARRRSFCSAGAPATSAQEESPDCGGDPDCCRRVGRRAPLPAIGPPGTVRP